MGEGASPVVVADAGPLIHLYEVGRLPLLGVVFPLIHVPQAVWDESTTAGRVPERDLELAAAFQRHLIAQEQVARVAALPEAAGLHRGELESLALCQATKAELLLTDDLAARRAAQLMSIRPVGSLGVIVRACYLGRLSLSEAEEAVERLYSVSTLFVSRTIVDLAIAQLRQAKP
jgi:predicted nucleic acid-binding protein